MEIERLKELLAKVQRGDLHPDRALAELRELPFSELGKLKLDNHRQLRTGLPEVVFSAGKSLAELTAVISRLNSSGFDALLTRLDAERAMALEKEYPCFVYHKRARVGIGYLTENHKPALTGAGIVAIFSAGASDAFVAEEAQISARVLGAEVIAVTDVGVAGIHRLQNALPMLATANAVIVVAGMEGALPSVVAGLTDKPVIAVPTSVGYGASFGGIAALLGMLNSCAAGVAVVNIDNGFGAAAMAVKIARQATMSKSSLGPLENPTSRQETESESR
ncbi:nickel pincer cofactor biosynthesis protein LarB [Gemmatimonas aurantiaca]|nr:nickel pincer cofactor biosynthesis protein LarB [Gemmatimonas aurantiaca]